MLHHPLSSTLFPYTTLFRSRAGVPRSGNDTPVRAEPAGAIEVVREDDGRRTSILESSLTRTCDGGTSIKKSSVRRTRIGRPGVRRAAVGAACGSAPADREVA